MVAVLETQGMTLGELIGSAAGSYAATEITELAADHRDVVAGAAFIALAGARTHGLDFAAAARARGAAVVLYDPATSDRVPPGPSVALDDLRGRLGTLARTFYGPRVSRSTIVGITGTNGKTTVAYLLAQALAELGSTCAYIGTLGFGVPPRLAAHRLTTPDCVTLHREIAALSAANVALEVSSHALAQDRTAGLDLRHAVFTNLSHDHLDAHGDIESYGRAKSRLFTRSESERAVLNVDDAFTTTLRQSIASSVRVIGVTSRDAAGADLIGRPTLRGLAGLRIEVSGAFGRGEITSPLVGEFNASNLLLTLGALLSLDLGVGESCAALAACRPPPGRMEVFGGDSQPWVVVDYAHTPDALRRVIATLRECVGGALWCVFGCGGERDAKKRPKMGRIAAAADHVILTDDNPRGEDPAAIVTEIRAGIRAHPSLHVEHDRRAAVAYAITRAQAGDVVLVAGRGAESQQLFADRAVALDDRDVAVSILGQRA